MEDGAAEPGRYLLSAAALSHSSGFILAVGTRSKIRAAMLETWTSAANVSNDKSREKVHFLSQL